MKPTREMSTLILTILADACWLFPVTAVFGLALDQAGSVLSLTGTLAILTIGVLSTRLSAAKFGASSQTYMALAAAGMVTVYLAVAATILRSGDFWELGWFFRFGTGDITGPEFIRIFVIVLTASYLWRRSVQIADEPMPDDRLRRTFRTGTLALALVLVVEFATGYDLGATDTLVPFFVVSLCALALIHRPQDPLMARNWAKIATLTVTVIVAAGLLFGLLGGYLGSGLLTILGTVWTYFLAAAAWILELLLAPLLQLFFALIEALRPEDSGQPLPPISRPNVNWDRLDVAQAGPFVDAVVSFLRFPVIALFLYLLIRFLIRSHRLWSVTDRASPVTVAHEAVERDGDTLGDIARMLDHLLPEWLRKRADVAARRYPEGISGISEVYRLYFDMLDLAADRGLSERASATPIERIPALETTLPSFPVRRLTDMFNAACFRQSPSPQEAIDALRDALETETEAREKEL